MEQLLNLINEIASNDEMEKRNTRTRRKIL